MYSSPVLRAAVSRPNPYTDLLGGMALADLAQGRTLRLEELTLSYVLLRATGSSLMLSGTLVAGNAVVWADPGPVRRPVTGLFESYSNEQTVWGVGLGLAPTAALRNGLLIQPSIGIMYFDRSIMLRINSQLIFAASLRRHREAK